METAVTNQLKSILERHLVLFAPNVDVFCSRLNYRSRRSYYNLLQGRSSNMNEFRNRLRQVYDCGDYEVKMLYHLTEQAPRLERNIRKFYRGASENAMFDAVISLILADFSKFASGIVSTANELNEIWQDDADYYYMLLAYIYVMDAATPVPKRIESYETRCKKILELTYEMIDELLPYHTGPGIMLENMRPYFLENMTLFSLIDMLHTVLRAIKEQKEIKRETGFVSLKGVGQRSYWIGADRTDSIFILLNYDSHNCCYQMFSFNSKSEETGSVHTLSFTKDGICVFVAAGAYIGMAGTYEFDGEKLRFEWDDTDNPTGLGDTWHLQHLERRAVLRAFDKRLEDEYLQILALEAQGMTYKPEMEVCDVVCSRRRLILEVESGKRFGLELEKFEGLDTVTPGDTVIIGYLPDEDDYLVLWPQCGLFVELSRFTELPKEK